MKTTIDRAGRVVIPKALRERAGLKPGGEVEIRCSYGVIEVIPEPTKGRLIREGPFLVWEAVPGTPPITPEQINDAIQFVREERENEILGNRT
jgi:AbrB family looped-hinge helix DNA binding protein